MASEQNSDRPSGGADSAPTRSSSPPSSPTSDRKPSISQVLEADHSTTRSQRAPSVGSTRSTTDPDANAASQASAGPLSASKGGSGGGGSGGGGGSTNSVPAAQRVFPVSSIVSAAGGTPSDQGHPLSPTHHREHPQATSGNRERSTTNTERDYFRGIGRSHDYDAQQQQQQGDGSPGQETATHQHTSSHSSSDPTTQGRGSDHGRKPPGLNHQDSSHYVERLHRHHQEVHAEPDADEIIRRARAARQRHEKLEQQSETESSVGSTLEPLMTARFEHQETEDGHMIITGRADELKRCEDEPIHVPGAVQAWGVLMALEITEDGRFVVVQVSENAGHLLGLPAKYLFKLSCFTQVLIDEEEAGVLRDAIETMPTSDAELSQTGPAHFELAGSGLPGTGLDGRHSRNEWLCWCSMHRPARESRPNLVVIEFELQDDNLNPARTESKEPFNDEDRTGLSGLPYEPTEDDLLESTINAAKPIRTSRARRRAQPSNDYKGADIFQTLGQITDQLSKAEDLPQFLKITVGIMQDLTNYHRVMIYQFDEQWNGQVVAELVDWSKTRDLYRGLHFPAADIPAQARELYRVNRVRLLYDRDQPTARMVCRNHEELESPLDMTHCALRAMSPIHIKYLANMGVRASCSVSITAFGSLWGLISMHSYGRFGFRINSQQRQLCRILGDNISRNIERLSYAQRLHSRKLINTVSSKDNPSGYIIARAEDLLSLFDADFGCLSIGDEAKLLGTIENSQEILAILEYLRQKRFLTIQASQNVAEDFEDLHYPAGFKVVSGLLLVPLSQSGRDFIAFFRRGQIKHIHWAGNPYDKYLSGGEVEGRSSLEPRTSFKLWSETVLGKSKSWSDDQFETASVLALVYGKFIDVWRQKEVALRSHELTNLLLANASHEVRTPLNHIVGYLEMALEGPLDDDTREALTKSYSASKSLIHVINDLLDLTRAEEGQALFLKDPLDLPTIVEEAVCIFREEAQRHDIDFEVVCTSDKLPKTFIGDRGRTKQIIANITANATKHTHEGSIRIEWGRLNNPQELSLAVPAPHEVMMYFSIQDTGVGIEEEKLDKLFRQFEQVDSYDPQEGDAPAQSALGLGLAVVARLTRTLGGQLRVESTVGQGSRFTIILPFGTEPASQNQSPAPSLQRQNSRSSIGSKASLRSGSSGQASEIDSLVEAISTDHMKPHHGQHRQQQQHPQSPQKRGSGSSQIAAAPRPAPESPPPPTTVGLNKPAPESPGSVEIEGSQFPIRPVKVQDNELDASTASQRVKAGPTPASQQAPASQAAPPTPPETPSEQGIDAEQSSTKPAFGTTWKPIPTEKPPSAPPKSADSPKLNVLVVEDDPINRAILQRKLVKDGHNVQVGVHGHDGVRKFEADPNFDIVLMDLQMPVCNGQEATKRIRNLEKSGKTSDRLSHRLSGGVPIFAVSASLYERQRPEMMECGLDGWILKPINFDRLKVLLGSTVSAEARKPEVYKPGQFERGGWFSEAKAKS